MPAVPKVLSLNPCRIFLNFIFWLMSFSILFLFFDFLSFFLFFIFAERTSFFFF